MAKLGSYFGLCPLIDQKSLLGINDDVENGNILVTLGKNMVIKYRISDQKQLQSWRTKEKLTSPVVYDNYLKKYCAVFNETYLRVWGNEDDNLDKLKKYKFDKTILTLLNFNGNSFIVFQNGFICTLEKALNDEGLQPNDVINQNSSIIDVLSLHNDKYVYIGLLIKAEGLTLQWTCYMEEKIVSENNIINLTDNYANLKLIGYVLTQLGPNDVNLLTIWSNSRMWKHPLNVNSLGDEYFALMDSLLCTDNITMISLDDDYIALYGADTDQEGANLIIYNVQFKIRQSRLLLKMFTSKNKLWRLQNNLFLCMEQNLAVVPYHLDVEQISALVGTLKTMDTDIAIVDELEVAKWNDNVVNMVKVIPTRIKKDLANLLVQGMCEVSICEEIIQKYIEQNNIKCIEDAVNYFTDIPDEQIVKLLDFVLNANADIFRKTNKATAIPLPLRPFERCKLLDKLLMLQYSEVIMLPELRKYLDLETSMLLLRYISYMLSEDGHTVENHSVIYSERKLIEWGSIIIDANYQKIILSRDEKLTELLQYFNGLITANLCSLEDLHQLTSLLIGLEQSKFRKSNDNFKYSIESIKLYE